MIKNLTGRRISKFLVLPIVKAHTNNPESGDELVHHRSNCYLYVMLTGNKPNITFWVMKPEIIKPLVTVLNSLVW